MSICLSRFRDTRIEEDSDNSTSYKYLLVRNVFLGIHPLKHGAPCGNELCSLGLSKNVFLSPYVPHPKIIYTIAVNTGPLEDQVLLNSGANILFHTMKELSDSWKELLSKF